MIKPQIRCQSQWRKSTNVAVLFKKKSLHKMLPAGNTTHRATQRATTQAHTKAETIMMATNIPQNPQ